MTPSLENAIAIIGMACRLPLGDTPEQFWSALLAGEEAVRVYSDAQLLANGADPERLHDPRYVKAAVPLPGRQLFDARFFNIAPREASLMDPQQRLLLQTAYHALENAGQAPEHSGAHTGVFVGADTSSYYVRNLLANTEATRHCDPVQLLYNNSGNATQIAYRLNLRGPALDINTACSTSLVAVHQACRSLLMYECDMALAGGASVQAAEPVGYLYRPDSILSADGHCRAFDAQASGTVPGQGVALVVLKRYEDAVRDGDRIDALIAGSAVNNDGANKVGYTAPSVDGQVALLRQALAVAGLAPAAIGYVECHGTGTALGDPIELTALDEVYGAQDRIGYLGSLKSNLGHLNSAAGVAGLIKAALCVRQRQLPASLNVTRVTDKVALHGLEVNLQRRDWGDDGQALYAAVSSFGIGGTNAHVVLQSAPPSTPPQPGPGPWLLCLSAKSEDALARKKTQLAAHMRAHPEVALADVCSSASHGRSEYACRHAQLVEQRQQCIAELEGTAPATALPSAAERWQRGEAVDLAALLGERRPPVPLPGYPFEAVRHWIDAPDTLAPLTSALAPSAPGSTLEAEIAGLWSELLGIETIALTDDFFDLGGHSLLATQLNARIYQRFGIELTLDDLFDHPTVQASVALLLRHQAATPEDTRAC